MFGKRAAPARRLSGAHPEPLDSQSLSVYIGLYRYSTSSTVCADTYRRVSIRCFSIRFRSYESAAVISDILYTSSALHPRDRSLIGALSPWRIGPNASNPPSLCAILYPMLPDSMLGKMKVLACPATLLPSHFCFATTGDTAASN